MDKTLLNSLKMLIPFWENSSEAWGLRITSQCLFMQIIGLVNY